MSYVIGHTYEDTLFVAEKRRNFNDADSHLLQYNHAETFSEKQIFQE